MSDAAAATLFTATPFTAKKLRAQRRMGRIFGAMAFAILAPLIAVVMWMGIYPESFLGIMSRSVSDLLASYHSALGARADIAPLGSQLFAFLR